jgi:hypothetical protein
MNGRVFSASAKETAENQAWFQPRGPRSVSSQSAKRVFQSERDSADGPARMALGSRGVDPARKWVPLKVKDRSPLVYLGGIRIWPVTGLKDDGFEPASSLERNDPIALVNPSFDSCRLHLRT